MEITQVYTNGAAPDFVYLTALLDDEFFRRYGDVYLQYQPYNTPEDIHDVVLLYTERYPIACGGFKRYDAQTAEIKRIFVTAPYRGRGLSKRILISLEDIAAKKGYRRVILETGADMPVAISLYKTSGYQTIRGFGPYRENTASVCMEKVLTVCD